MRVGLSLKYTLPECGGGFTFEREIFASLVEAAPGCRHTFVVFGPENEAPPEIGPAGPVAYVPLPRPDAGPGSAARAAVRTAASRLRRVVGAGGVPGEADADDAATAAAVRAQRIDVSWSLGPGCLSREMPYIATVWDLQHRLQPYFPEVSRGGQWEMRERFYAATLGRASFVFTGTEEGKSEIMRFYGVPSERIKVLPLPTPRFALDAFAREVPRAVGFGLPPGILLYPSQFWPHKNHVGLLRAARRLRDRDGLVVPLVFVGSDQGNEGFARKMAAGLGLSEQVRFLGFVPQEELIALYRNAFALAFVSFFGPDNLPPLEAFALGCPVIASDVPGAREQLGDAALLVDPRDEDRIADAVKALHDDPALREDLRQRGLRRAAAWTGADYVKGVIGVLDAFESIRRCWE